MSLFSEKKCPSAVSGMAAVPAHAKGVSSNVPMTLKAMPSAKDSGRTKFAFSASVTGCVRGPV